MGTILQSLGIGIPTCTPGISQTCKLAKVGGARVNVAVMVLVAHSLAVRAPEGGLGVVTRPIVLLTLKRIETITDLWLRIRLKSPLPP